MVVCHHSSFAVDGQYHLGPPAGRDCFQPATEDLLPSPTSSLLPTRSREGGIMGLRCCESPPQSYPVTRSCWCYLLIISLKSPPFSIQAAYSNHHQPRLLQPPNLFRPDVSSVPLPDVLQAAAKDIFVRRKSDTLTAQPRTLPGLLLLSVSGPDSLV